MSGRIRKNPMKIKKIGFEDRDSYNKLVDHPLQSWEWGEFRKKNGAKVERFGLFKADKLKSAFQVFFHPIPATSLTVGYFPKGPRPNKLIVNKVRELALENKAIFVKFEPNQIFRTWKNQKGHVDPAEFKEEKFDYQKLGLRKAIRPIFDPHTFILDLRKSETELLANMHPKTRYNIRLAQKKGVVVGQDNSKAAFTIFIRLLFEETVKRQGFYIHTPEYFKRMWKILSPGGIARLFLAKYKSDVLSAWIIFVWKNYFYYPYGASSSRFRNLMASNLICWEAIRFAKKLGLTKFDMWGGLPPQASPRHPWFGFHRFKLGYGADLVETVGSWDLVIRKPLYYT